MHGARRGNRTPSVAPEAVIVAARGHAPPHSSGAQRRAVHSLAGRGPYGQPRFGATRRKTFPASTIRGLITPRLEGHTVTKLPMAKFPDDRVSRLVVSAAVGALVFGLVVLFALLVADVDDGSDGSSRRCPGYTVGTVDPVTCLPYGSAGAPPAGTNHSGSGSSTERKPAAPPKAPAPAAKVPAAPKAPAAPPRIFIGKR